MAGAEDANPQNCRYVGQVLRRRMSMNINRIISRIREQPREVPGRMKAGFAVRELDGDVVKGLESAAGNIKLDAERCSKLETIIRKYVEQFQVGVVQRRDQKVDEKLAVILGHVDGLVESLKEIDFGIVDLKGPNDTQGKLSLHVGA